ncbi:hypothetical protein ACFQL4_22485 [Halosimplex aquaticum]
MSDATESARRSPADTGRRASLVNAESNAYDRGLDGVIALGVVSFALGLLSLVDLVALDASGAALGRSLLVLLAVAVGGIGAVGVASWANVVPVTSDRVRGIALGVLVATAALAVVAFAVDVRLATLLGVIMLVEAAGVLAAGFASRTGAVDTSPDASAGLLAGLSFAVVGALFGGAVGGSLVGFGSPAWIVVALAAAIGLGAVTIFPGRTSDRRSRRR